MKSYVECFKLHFYNIIYRKLTYYFFINIYKILTIYIFNNNYLYLFNKN